MAAVAADTGSVVAADTGHTPGFNERVYASSGGNEDTMWLMTYAVSVCYMLLIGFMLFRCCFSPRWQHVAAYDVEATQPTLASGAVAQPGVKPFVSELDQQWRKAFVVKVYSILVAQLALTFGISFSMMQFGGEALYIWLRTDGALARLASLLLMLGTLIGLMYNKNKHPLNFVLLTAFTGLMAFSIGCTAVTYAAAGLGVLVVEAFAITSIVFVGLTVFTMVSKIDFSFLGAILPVLLLCLLVWGFLGMFAFGGFAFRQLYSLAGVVIFSLYVLYDTHIITQRLAYDEFILAAIELYLDFVNLFLFILSFLQGESRN